MAAGPRVEAAAAGGGRGSGGVGRHSWCGRAHARNRRRPKHGAWGCMARRGCGVVRRDGEQAQLAAASMSTMASRCGAVGTHGARAKHDTVMERLGRDQQGHRLMATRAGSSAAASLRSSWLWPMQRVRRLGRARGDPERHHGHHAATTMASGAGAARPWRGSSAAGATTARGLSRRGSVQQQHADRHARGSAERTEVERRDDREPSGHRVYRTATIRLLRWVVGTTRTHRQKCRAPMAYTAMDDHLNGSTSTAQRRATRTSS